MPVNNNLFKLHFIVFIWGFTGILGRLISLEAIPLVWYRLIIATIVIAGFLIYKRRSFRITVKKAMFFLLTGIVVALHWWSFYYAIKVSNVSVAVGCFASTALFTGILEPLFFNRKIKGYEILLSIVVIFGIYIIFRFETRFYAGILSALISALLAALFTVLNKTHIKEEDASIITIYEFIGGIMFISVSLLFVNNKDLNLLPSIQDVLWLLILAIVCTTYTFIVSVDVMKTLSAFTVSFAVNLEPVYSIILAYFIFGDSEHMTKEFYYGIAIILIAVIVQPTISYIKKKKLLS